MDKLPVEILSKIIDYLNPREQVQLQSVNKRLFGLARDNNRWRLHCYEASWTATQAARPAGRTPESLVSNTTPLSSLGQTSLRSLIQPHMAGVDEVASSPSFSERTRAAVEWDPSVEGEDRDWYSEYIARNGPLSFSWLQQPFSRSSSRKDFREVKGMALLRDWSSARENKVVAPLDDGSVCIWDLNHSHSIGSQATKGRVLGVSAPGILMADLSGRAGKQSPSQRFINLGETMSVDSIRRRAYMAVGNVLNEVDLETLKVVSQQRYVWSISALSQETDYSAPLTLATTLEVHIYDARMSATEEEEAIHLRCEEPVTPLVPESTIYSPPDSPLLQLQPDGRPPQPQPALPPAPPAPYVNSIFLAGRFPSILQYDRRFFPRLQSTVHSGGSLCGLTSVPAPQFPVSSGGPYPSSHSVVACGEYKGRGSLELYNLAPSPFPSPSSPSPSDWSSHLSPAYQNRQSAARSKVLSVESHGSRIAFSDGDGNIKWVERNGRSEIRRFNLASAPPHQASHSHISDNDGSSSSSGGGGIWTSHSAPGDVAQKILSTGGNLTGDELLIWTGERLGRIRFSAPSKTPPYPSVEDEASDSDSDNSMDVNMDPLAREEARKRKHEYARRERDYSRAMRRALERQADEVRRMQGLGL
ncbi:hypothetical protein P168DRAFT_307245 [Aspergillus campestris IBT 28561]|uniref:F-box domain-containing protein n=1 Tax=Aspergillus campestris (strain IBT 28561) TaxID=1392248 RepID=A0A2I1CT65_ASPC2|nr:uncharacterized protein P168DRAFT_307245 [Aspergillus campestris IBT 28561]PKY00804.1 hypothetical protein P168DRAFT_307245 [Aspergillus campestris IBT 28561]